MALNIEHALQVQYDERGDALYPTFKGSSHKRHLFCLAREGETSMAVVTHVQPTFTTSEPPGSTFRSATRIHERPRSSVIPSTLAA
jgi:hypothetical protein